MIKTKHNQLKKRFKFPREMYIQQIRELFLKGGMVWNLDCFSGLFFFELEQGNCLNHIQGNNGVLQYTSFLC